MAKKISGISTKTTDLSSIKIILNTKALRIIINFQRLYGHKKSLQRGGGVE
jgi:hypothetical protein